MGGKMGISKLKDLKVRFGMSLLASLMTVLAIVSAPHPVFSFIFLGYAGLLMALALFEYFRLVQKKGLEPPSSLGISLGIVYLIASYLNAIAPPFLPKALSVILPEMVLGIAFFVCFAFFAYKQKSALLHIASTFFGIIYIAIPFGLIVRIPFLFGRESWEGIFWLVFLLVVTKSADMGAYFVGRLFGRRKLATTLSPNKTLEGALGGLFLSALFSILLLYFAQQSPYFTIHLSPFFSILLGLGVGLLGELGDLAESLLKRDADVKDSNSIPGIGGILDMVDSLLFTAPLLYIFLKTYLLFQL